MLQGQYHLLYKCVAVYCKMALGIETETKSPAGSPEPSKLCSRVTPPLSDKLTLLSPKCTNPFLQPEKPSLTINTTNGVNRPSNSRNTNPFIDDVPNDANVVCDTP